MRPRVAVAGFSLGPGEKRNVARVLATGRLSYGPFSRQFESRFARLHGRRHAVFCNSGTSALIVALAALKRRHGWKDGDEVLVPAVTFVATANAVAHARLTPVFVDVEPGTWCVDPEKLEAAALRRARAVIPVHLLGLPADMGAVMAIARRRRWSVVEDSCEAVLARFRGRPVGSFGEAACFSTYAAHQLVTGSGGMALAADAELAVRMRSLIHHGRDEAYLDIDAGRGLTGAALRRHIGRRFRFVERGFGFRPTELEAALGVAQLDRLPGLLERRRALARRMTNGLRDLADRLWLPEAPAGREHSYMNYGLVLRKGSAAGLVSFLEAAGVETRPLLPMLGQPAYARELRRSAAPVAGLVERGGFYVGCHPLMTDADADYVVERIHAWFRR